MKLLKKGDRIRLKTRLLSGWKGLGTVSEDQATTEGVVTFCKDGDDPDDWLFSRSIACRHEVAVVRKKSVAA